MQIGYFKMIKNKTTFILGAGASYPYGYPLGTELFNKIIELRREGHFLSLLEKAYPKELIPLKQSSTEDDYKELTYLLERSGLMSIDAFMIANPALAHLSKFAVTYLLLNQEEKNPNVVRRNSSGDWYRYLYNEFMSGSDGETISSVLRNEVNFITFNYDVSLERFFLNALESKFNRKDAIEFFKVIPIKHVYGKVRVMPWEKGATATDFLSHLEPNKIKEYSLGINYVHENGSDENIDSIRNLISESQKIIFLGFAFDVRNVEKLRIDWNKANVDFFACTFGMTKDEFLKKVQLLYIKNMTDGGPEKDSLELLRNIASQIT
jgi:hypothetical protein